MLDEYETEAVPGPGRQPDPETGEVIAAVLGSPLLTVEGEPDVFRLAVHHAEDIARWFKTTTGWRFEAYPTDGFCRLYKRRRLPPADRAPRLIRQQRSARRPASPLVLTLLCLVCEQLWRHPETSFQDLQRAIAQTCAAEAGTGQLPAFQPVALDAHAHARARVHRVALVDAVRLLASWQVVTVDRPLEIAEQDERADLAISARRERLLALLACLSPTLLDVNLDQPDTHVSLLCSDQAELPEHASAGQHDLRRRHVALQAVLDDPGVPPDSATEAGRYLASSPGRRLALDSAAGAGLTCTVRRDWWIIADPAGVTADLDFPHGRSQEQQAALVLLSELAGREDPTAAVNAEDATALLRSHLDRRAWWASRYRTTHGAQRLAEQALQLLTQVGVLDDAGPGSGIWQPTPAIHVWQVHIRDPADKTAMTAAGGGAVGESDTGEGDDDG